MGDTGKDLGSAVGGRRRQPGRAHAGTGGKTPSIGILRAPTPPIGGATNPYRKQSLPRRSVRPGQSDLWTARTDPKWWSAWPGTVRETAALHGFRSAGEIVQGRVGIAIHLYLNKLNYEHDDP